MHSKEHDNNLVDEIDNVGKNLQQHVIPNANPH